MMTRKAMLALALLLTVVASIWAARQPSVETVSALSRPTKNDQEVNRSRTTDTPTTPSVRVFSAKTATFEPLLLLQSRHIDDEGVDLFQVPVPLVPKAALRSSASAEPPPKPVAPPVPWRFAGRFVEGNQTYVLLTSPTKDVSVKQGDVIDSQYRVDAIEASAIVVTFLPLNEQQRIAIGDGG